METRRRMLYMGLALFCVLTAGGLLMQALFFGALALIMPIALIGYYRISKDRISSQSERLQAENAYLMADVMNRIADARCRAFSSNGNFITFHDCNPPAFHTRESRSAGREVPNWNGPQPDSSYPPLMPLLEHARIIALYGNQGAGKTNMMHWLIDAARGETLIIDPHGYRNKYSKGRLVGYGRNYSEIEGVFDDIMNEIDRRYQGFNGQQFPEMNIFIDEMTLLHSQCDNFKAFMRILLTESRKVGIRAAFCLHSMRSEFVGLKGGYDLLEDITIVNLKNDHGERYAEVKHDDGIRRYSLPGPYQTGGNHPRYAGKCSARKMDRFSTE